jgi:ribosomal protein L11 methyltransferase
MPYEQWLGEIFTTFEHGKFRVIPPWETPPDKKNTSGAKLSILLDPGLVFGTGTHPTTRDCLEALELAACPNPFNTVLDLGTGTGLLALAAARLGCKGVVAVDLNFLAAKTADRNVRLNHLQNRVVTVQGRAEDMIASFILSGLLRSEAKDIVDILARHQVKIIKQWTHEGIWHTFYGETN